MPHWTLREPQCGKYGPSGQVGGVSRGGPGLPGQAPAFGWLLHSAYGYLSPTCYEEEQPRTPVKSAD